jgi:hypothetical protein
MSVNELTPQAGRVSNADVMNLNVQGNLTILGNQTIAGTNLVTGQETLTLAPIISALTASQFVYTDANKGLVSSALVLLTQGTPVNAVASIGTLTSDNTNVANNATVTIGTKVYTFKDTLTPAEGEVLIGGDADASLLNLINAINHTGTPDTDYKCAAVHPLVSAAVSVTSHHFAITAKTKGVAGNAIVLSETSAHLSADGTGFLGGTTAGVDGTVGAAYTLIADTSYLYYAIAANTITGTNWRRISLGSAY